MKTSDISYFMALFNKLLILSDLTAWTEFLHTVSLLCWV